MSESGGTASAMSKEDFERMGELSGIPITWLVDGQDADGDIPEPSEVPDLLREMADTAFTQGGDAFARFAAVNRARIREAAETGDEVVELLVLCYRFGIAAGSGACMNDLGALYYLGDLVEQDFEMAAGLYEAAMAHGCYQSIINLGYIYEYGRIGEPDHERAYRYFALAAALEPSCEAVYKLGDMYARGKAVERDMPKARALWERSLELADSVVERAQPAVRIAGLLTDPDAPAQGLQNDPLRALSLYQQAEIGLRMDIANGQVYYRKRLKEAIDGQRRARELLEAEEDGPETEW